MAATLPEREQSHRDLVYKRIAEPVALRRSGEGPEMDPNDTSLLIEYLRWESIGSDYHG